MSVFIFVSECLYLHRVLLCVFTCACLCECACTVYLYVCVMYICVCVCVSVLIEQLHEAGNWLLIRYLYHPPRLSLFSHRRGAVPFLSPGEWGEELARRNTHPGTPGMLTEPDLTLTFLSVLSSEPDTLVVLTQGWSQQALETPSYHITGLHNIWHIRYYIWHIRYYIFHHYIFNLT